MNARYVYRDWLTVRGNDASRFLQGMWTCDFRRAGTQPPATGRGLLLTNKGKLVSEATFLCLGTREFLLAVPSGLGEATRANLERYLIADEVEIICPSPPPFARVGLANVDTGTDVAGPPLAKDVVMSARSTEWGWELPPAEMWVRTELSPRPTCTDAEWIRHRIERGIPEWGMDYQADSFPLEFPFADRISFFKGCYIGQETVAIATFRGHVTRVFCRFHANGPLTSDLIYMDSEGDRAVGKLTTVDGNLGLGLLRMHATQKTGELYQKNGSRFQAVEPLVNEETYKSS